MLVRSRGLVPRVRAALVGTSFAAVVALAAGVAPAGAAPALSRASSLSSTLKQRTGYSSSQLTTVNACGNQADRAHCFARVLVLKSNHQPVRPEISADSHTAQFGNTAESSSGFGLGFASPFSITGSSDSAADAVPAGVSQPGSGTAAFLQESYDLGYLSADSGGTQTVAVIDAYDDPYVESDLATFRSQNGLPACGTSNGCFSEYYEADGVQTTAVPPPSPSGDDWSVEESLDVDSVSALCPNCKIIVVEAASDDSTSDDYLADLMAAAHIAVEHRATELSMSYGAPETITDREQLDSEYPLTDTEAFASSGDSGYLTPDISNYPASDAGVTAVGGTTLYGDATTPRGMNESAWSVNSKGVGGGSGCETTQSVPAYQTGIDTGCDGRAYADVSADAAVETGLNVYDTDPTADLGSSHWVIVGGTSLASPLTAAYAALTAVNASTPAWPYTDASELNDITDGSTGTCEPDFPAQICNAEVGWDAPTGVGSISGDVVAGDPGTGGEDITDLGGSAATLSGGIYTNGSQTSYQWQISTNSSFSGATEYPASAATISAANGATEVSTSWTVPSATTTYYYRLVATNSTGTAYGYMQTFKASEIPVSTTTPTNSGTAQVGDVLTTDGGYSGWSSPIDGGYISIEWQSSASASGPWSQITDASSDVDTLTLGADEQDKYIRALVYGTNPDGSAVTYSGVVGPIGAHGPENTVAPSISGTAQQGVKLTTSPGTWSPSGTPSYQWQLASDPDGDWSDITDSSTTPNAATFTPDAAEVGDYLRVQVSEDGGSPAPAYSAAIGPVAAPAPAKPVVKTVPKFTGTAKVGATVKVSGGAITNGSVSAITLYRCAVSCTAIKSFSAASASYKLPAADAGYYLRAKFTASGTGGSVSAYAAGTLGPVMAPTAGAAALASDSSAGKLKLAKSSLTVSGSTKKKLLDVKLAKSGSSAVKLTLKPAVEKTKLAVWVYTLKSGVPVARKVYTFKSSKTVTLKLAAGQSFELVAIN